MIYLSAAIMFLGVLGFLGFREWMGFKKPVLAPTDSIEELRADVNRIKLMLNIRTFTGEKQ